ARDPAQRPATALEVANGLSPFTEKADLVALIISTRASANAASKTSRGAETISSKQSPPQPQPLNSKPLANGWKWIALASLAALVGAAVVFALDTSQGQLVIDSQDANVQIKLRRDGQEYRDLTIHPGTQVTKLYSGKYEIILDQPSDRISISPQKFEIH